MKEGDKHIGITLTNKDLYYFSLAEKVSQLSDHYNYHIGAVIVHKNKIVSLGRNQLKSHWLQQKYNVYRGFAVRRDNLHAEMDAIRNAHTDDLSGCRIYIFRRKKTGELGLARPCGACYKALETYGVDAVYFTTDNGYEAMQISRERLVG